MGGIRVNEITHEDMYERYDRGAALERISRRAHREVRRKLRRTSHAHQK
jgi:hypothetical protein